MTVYRKAEWACDGLGCDAQAETLPAQYPAGWSYLQLQGPGQDDRREMNLCPLCTAEAEHAIAEHIGTLTVYDTSAASTLRSVG